MYELNFYDKETDELVRDFELPRLTSKDIFDIFGFSLDGNCADVSEEQLNKIELLLDRKFNIEGCQISICEVT
ncbi:MAG: hypothetical protein WCF45_12870 [Photobacterium halotolerans]